MLTCFWTGVVIGAVAGCAFGFSVCCWLVLQEEAQADRRRRQEAEEGPLGAGPIPAYLKA